MSSLTANQVALQLESLSGWATQGNSLHKTYHFADFPSVIAFMAQVAFHAQELEHYPNWCNHYTSLSVQIGDQEQREMRGRDIQLAKRLEQVYRNFYHHDN